MVEYQCLGFSFIMYELFYFVEVSVFTCLFSISILPFLSV
jgi:hypothetical protein